MKVGDLVKNLHGLVPTSMGIVVEISTPQSNPWASPDCPYKVHWFDSTREPAWMAERWLEVISD